MRFVFKIIVFPFWLITAFLALMLKWTLNLSAFVLALPILFRGSPMSMGVCTAF